MHMCAVSQLLSLLFTAYFEKDVNWNVVIKVERKATDLRVNVKAQGYAITCQLTCEDISTGDKQLMSATAVNDINLGRVSISPMPLTLSIISASLVRSHSNITSLSLSIGGECVKVCPSVTTERNIAMLCCHACVVSVSK